MNLGAERITLLKRVTAEGVGGISVAGVGIFGGGGMFCVGKNIWMRCIIDWSNNRIIDGRGMTNITTSMVTKIIRCEHISMIRTGIKL